MVYAPGTFFGRQSAVLESNNLAEESPIEAVIARFVRAEEQARPDWLIDVGVGNGREARVLRKIWPWIKCLGLEPCPELYEASRREEWAGILDSHSNLLLDIGAWSHPCDCMLYIDSDNPKKSSVCGKTTFYKGARITCRPLDQVCNMHEIYVRNGIIWCDVEGAELEVLRGAWELFREKQILAVNLEVRDVPLFASACSRAQVEAFLAAFGFACVAEYNFHADSDPHRDAIYLRTDQSKVWL